MHAWQCKSPSCALQTPPHEQLRPLPSWPKSAFHRWPPCTSCSKTLCQGETHLWRGLWPAFNNHITPTRPQTTISLSTAVHTKAAAYTQTKGPNLRGIGAHVRVSRRGPRCSSIGPASRRLRAAWRAFSALCWCRSCLGPAFPPLLVVHPLVVVVGGDCQHLHASRVVNNHVQLRHSTSSSAVLTSGERSACWCSCSASSASRPRSSTPHNRSPAGSAAGIWFCRVSQAQRMCCAQGAHGHCHSPDVLLILAEAQEGPATCLLGVLLPHNMLVELSYQLARCFDGPQAGTLHPLSRRRAGPPVVGHCLQRRPSHSLQKQTMFDSPGLKEAWACVATLLLQLLMLTGLWICRGRRRRCSAERVTHGPGLSYFRSELQGSSLLSLPRARELNQHHQVLHQRPHIAEHDREPKIRQPGQPHMWKHTGAKQRQESLHMQVHR